MVVVVCLVVAFGVVIVDIYVVVCALAHFLFLLILTFVHLA